MTDQSKSDRDAVTIRLFGELAVISRDGRNRAMPQSRKTRALLGFLAIAGGEQRRERLCDLLWNGPDDPRGALRWSLSRLPPVLDDADHVRIVADREHVRFDLRYTKTDLAVVRQAVAREVNRIQTNELAEIFGAIDGELLTGLDLPGCPRFHAWLLGERATARRHHAAILTALLERTDQSPEQAVSCGRALVALDPIAQGSYVSLLRLLARLGRISEAREQYDACLSVLREFGQVPSSELITTHLALMAHPSAASVTEPSPIAPASDKAGSPADALLPTSVPGPTAATPFVGRA